MNYLFPRTIAMVALFGVPLSAMSAPTFTVDSLFKVGNERGNGALTLTNTQSETVYVKANVAQVKVKQGKITHVPLTRDNFPLWDLAVNPSKLRLLPGEIRDMAVKYLCQQDCDRSEDLVYQISLAPVAPPEEQKEGEQNVSFAFGMAPYYIVPALERKVDYQWDYDKTSNTVSVHNTGNTYLRIQFDNCHVMKDDRRCKVLYHLLAGRYKEIELPEGIKGTSVKVSVADYDYDFHKEFTL